MAIHFDADLAKVTRSITAYAARMETATERGLGLAAHDLEAEAKRNSTGPARWRGGRNFPREGGPGVVTGAHRRGIVVDGPKRERPGRLSVLIGPTMVYSRALEKGNPRWRRRGGYPYMEPALQARRAALQQRIEREWSAARSR